MGAVGAWYCPECGGLRTTAEGSTDPLYAAYAKPHVCRCVECGQKGGGHRKTCSRRPL